MSDYGVNIAYRFGEEITNFSISRKDYNSARSLAELLRDAALYGRDLSPETNDQVINGMVITNGPENLNELVKKIAPGSIMMVCEYNPHGVDVIYHRP